MCRRARSWTPARSSARTGTTISAAPVGVGARMSAAWSIRVQSVSCPTAETSGMSLSAAARTTTSSLKPQRSSIEPPPRATISTSGRGIGPPGAQRVEAADGRRHLRGAGLALDPHGPDQDVAGKAVLQAVQDVADDRAGRGGHDADDLRQVRQRPLARRCRTALRRSSLRRRSSSSAISAPMPAGSSDSTTIW